ncbi:hypothetical protein SAMN05443667_10410 [Flavobacterium gillisiae]|uniref:Uncharacterized protein n=1 Tax=Flavobacterium gillisiae TaxID=150146 RepID=A0A1H4AR48_9FLAO|nr:hypothetical protein [Flavobacterium gillisiae]SEA38192.1 hypothetical protein SAMN05443667_10410 [Flavobacterium gillisiae]
MRKIRNLQTGNRKTGIVLLLGLLLLLAPCSFRNLLQQEFSVKTTKTLNKNQSSFQKKTSCNIGYCSTTIVKEEQTIKAPLFPFLSTISSTAIGFATIHPSILSRLTSVNPNKNTIPFYILFKRFKVYDAALRFAS